jgi:hypothetical protein
MAKTNRARTTKRLLKSVVRIIIVDVIGMKVVRYALRAWLRERWRCKACREVSRVASWNYCLGHAKLISMPITPLLCGKLLARIVW